MGNYEQLKDAVTAVIKANGKKEITGQILQDTLLAMINSLGSGAVFAGIATPSTKPGTPDQNVFYIAGQNGTYTNFGGAVLKNEVATFTIKNGTWQKETLVNILDASQGNRALYVAAGAVYNEQTGFYELNGLTDITEEQMRNIYVETQHATRQPDLTAIFANTYSIRTNYPLKVIGGYKRVDCYAAFAGNGNIEVASFMANSVFYASRVNYLFQNCKKLRTVLGVLRCDLVPQEMAYENMFYNCFELVTVNLRGVKYDISFSNSPKISLDSLKFLINSSSNASAITVTVHADVYSKIQDETQADWHALIEAAQEKQITFATA